MKRELILVCSLAVGSAVLGWGCGDKPEPAKPGATAKPADKAPEAANAAAPTQAAEPEVAEDPIPAPPSPAELQKIRDDVTEENADRVAEELERELEAELAEETE